MGCDVHVSVQVKEGEEWKNVVWQQSRWPHEIEDGKKQVPDVPVAPYQLNGRSYDTFAILANVRNGVGFAGTETGTGWPSIAPDRGLPDGFDEETVPPDPLDALDYPDPESQDKTRYMGDHSFTWVSLDELKAFPWDLTAATLYGVISAQQYEKRRAEGITDGPANYSQGVRGPGIKTYSQEQWEAIRERKLPLPELKAVRPGQIDLEWDAKDYVRVSWTETAREATNDYPGKVIPWLEELAAGRPLRLVLGFDS